jgi:hypothetical protein
MARIAVNVNHALINVRSGRIMPGAPYAVQELVNRGHHVSAFLPPHHGYRHHHEPQVVQQITVNLQQAGIPVHEVHVTHNPQADVIIDNNGIPYRGNWPQTLAMALMHAGAAPSLAGRADEVFDEGEAPPLDGALDDSTGE